jgi:predicted Zn-ribbon and HTH transcriptional regulator
MKITAGANIFIVGNKCFRCNHEWIPSKKAQIPKVCPKCKSPYWDRPKVKFDKHSKK